MSELQRLAEEYQQALDGSAGAAWGDEVQRAGVALLSGMQSACHWPGTGGLFGWSALKPIILDTTLAASIAACFETMSWALFAPHMLDTQTSSVYLPTAILQVGSKVLIMLFQIVVDQDTSSRETIQAAILLLRQVGLFA